MRTLEGIHKHRGLVTCAYAGPMLRRAYGLHGIPVKQIPFRTPVVSQALLLSLPGVFLGQEHHTQRMLRMLNEPFTGLGCLPKGTPMGDQRIYKQTQSTTYPPSSKACSPWAKTA